MRTKIKQHKFIVAFVLFISSLICILWSIVTTDQEMRKQIHHKARISLQTLSISLLSDLTGTQKDLDKSEYKQLKKQLRFISYTTSNCRFAYLMGIKPDGKIFFYADSEPEGFPDESLPVKFLTKPLRKYMMCLLKKMKR